MSWFRRKPAVSLGEQGETLAAQFLRKQGYRVLERNAQLGRYEVDIIAQEGDTVAFVEVKTRRDDTHATPETNVHRKKQRHIRNAAHTYMARQDDPDMYYRFDVVSVVLPHNCDPEITLFRDAFHDE